MACGGCGARRASANTKVSLPKDYDLARGLDIKSLNNRQINARLEVFKRKFCKECSIRYECNYSVYLDCRGLNKR